MGHYHPLDSPFEKGAHLPLTALIVSVDIPMPLFCEEPTVYMRVTLTMNYCAICTKPDTHRPQVIPRNQVVADVSFQYSSTCLALRITLKFDGNERARGPGTKALTE